MLRLAAADKAIIARGLAALVIIIALGLVVAENQLNSLTHQQDFVQVLNLKRDLAAGTYTVFVFGDSHAFKALIPVGGISNTDEYINLELLGWKWRLPVRIKATQSDISYLLGVWHRRFIAESLRLKEFMGEEYGKLRPVFDNIVNSVKHPR